MPEFTKTKDGEGRWELTFVTDEAATRAANIPAWATWTETQAQDWIDSNVTDLPTAVVALKAMARLIVALRDATWPNLTD